MPTTATPEQFADYLVSGWFLTYADPVLGQSFSGRHSWGAGATVTWSPDPGTDFSAGDLDAMAHALQLWSEVADVNFVQVAPGTGQISFAPASDFISQEHQFALGDVTQSSRGKRP